MFAGGGEVSLNTNANLTVCNDKCKQLMNIYKNLNGDFTNEVKEVINKWKLNKWSKNEFLKLRQYYNDNLKNTANREQAVTLYCLLTHAFNYQIAFNSKYEYNMPSGASRSYFSKNLETKLNEYIKVIQNKNINFFDYDFISFPYDAFDNLETFYYVDPPYLITTGAYERDYFCKWSNEYEYQLLNKLDELNHNGNKFALSNVLEHKGKENTILKHWCKKYNVHFLDKNYNNCNYQTKVKQGNSSTEVLITNY